MRILVAHNSYEQAGGEDAVVKAEYELLEKNGQDVFLYTRSNSEIKSLSGPGKLKFLLQLKWSRKSYNDLRVQIRKIRPDIAHFHNIFYMITPSVYDACHDEGIPVVQSQHNFRPLCSNGLFLRNHRVCEECLEHSLWRGVRYGCFKGSRLATWPVASMLMAHQKKGTWSKKVDRYIVAAEFTRQKYIQAGFPEHKISVKPHFVFPPQQSQSHDQGYALYIGRLSEEKGVDVLLKAWESLPEIPLRVIGTGPLLEELKRLAWQKGMSQVQFLGYVSYEQYDSNFKAAKFLVVPSICYESLPRVMVEAYSYGIPVLASRLGSMKDSVIEQKTGLLFESGNTQDLAQKARWLVQHQPELEEMRRSSREEYKQKYLPQKNYAALMAIYEKAIYDYKSG